MLLCSHFMSLVVEFPNFGFCWTVSQLTVDIFCSPNLLDNIQHIQKASELSATQEPG